MKTVELTDYTSGKTIHVWKDAVCYVMESGPALLGGTIIGFISGPLCVKESVADVMSYFED